MKILNMNSLIILFFFILFFNDYAQDEKTKIDSTYIVELKEFYDGKGVVFGKDVEYCSNRDSADQRISLTLEDVIEAEKIMDSLATLYYKDDIDSKKEYDSKLRGYFRQYFGLKSIFNEKKIAIIMLNLNDPETRAIMEDRWDKGDTFVSGTILDKEFRFINITKREMLGRPSLLFWRK